MAVTKIQIFSPILNLLTSSSRFFFFFFLILLSVRPEFHCSSDWLPASCSALFRSATVIFSSFVPPPFSSRSSSSSSHPFIPHLLLPVCLHPVFLQTLAHNHPHLPSISLSPFVSRIDDISAAAGAKVLTLKLYMGLFYVWACVN